MSDNWLSISVSDLEDAKVADLVVALRESALGDDQDDPTDRIILDVVRRIRRKIASNSANTVDEDETKIPRGLKSDAVALILQAMKGRLEIELTPDEIRTVDRIEKDLNRIASGEDSIEQPDDAIESPAQPTNGSPRYEARTRRYDRCDAEGL
jgi:hypothetical protein